jgi:outer membrane protein TolC
VSVRYIQSLLRNAGTRIATHPIRIALYSKGAVDASTKLAAISILTNADVAYWRLYAARKDLEVSREQYKLSQNQLRDAHAKVEAGSAPRNEIIRAEAGLAVRLEVMINAETSVRDRERDLKRIMNRPDMPVNSRIGLVAMTEPDPRGLELDADRLAAVALENRMELAQLEFFLAQDDIDVELARNDLLPRLTLDYAYSAGGESATVGRAFDDTFGDPFQDHRVGLSAGIPLGNRAAEARLRRARLQRVRREVDRDRLQQQIAQEVYQAVDGLEQNWRRILAAEQGLGQAYRAYEVEQLQFQLGNRTSTEVLIAADRLADAQLRRIQVFAQYEIAQALLAQATGVLLGRDPIPLQPVDLEGK